MYYAYPVLYHSVTQNSIFYFIKSVSCFAKRQALIAINRIKIIIKVYRNNITIWHVL